MTTNTLPDLIARIEAATGLDRALDAEICHAIHGRPSPLGGETWLQVARVFSVPRFTGSIDAAVTLVPTNGGWRWLLDRRPYAGGRPDGYRAEVWCAPRIEPSDTASWLATPALALCAAALKARLLQ